MKTIYIGDIHGHIEVIQYVRKTFKNHMKVFVGDLLDAFDRTRAEQMECLNLVIEMIEEGTTKMVMGNHEMGYLVPREMQCSGFAKKFYNELQWHQLLAKMWKLFPYYLWDAENKILVTHAGLTNHIWKEYKITVENLEDTFFNWMRDPYYVQPLYWIGKARGGNERVGGPLWCDWNKEFTPVEGITQIMGHTVYVDIHHDLTYGIRKWGTNYNIDCLGRRLEFLEFDDETKQFNTIFVDEELKI